MIGNKFLVRGYENGQHVMFKEEYSPTLFVKTTKKSKYKTLDGESVEPINPGFVSDCREFYKKYDGVEGFKIYGNDRYISQYISDKYPEQEIKFDNTPKSNSKTFFLDKNDLPTNKAVQIVFAAVYKF